MYALSLSVPVSVSHSRSRSLPLARALSHTFSHTFALLRSPPRSLALPLHLALSLSLSPSLTRSLTLSFRTHAICGVFTLSVCVCNPPPCLVLPAASRVIWLRLCVCRFDGLSLPVIGQCMYILVLLPLRQSVLAGLQVRRWSISHCQSAAGLLVRSAHVHGAYWTWLGAMWLVRWDENGGGICGGLDVPM
jgi:hypothetical protein